MAFVDLVIEQIEKGKCHRAFSEMEPGPRPMLFCDNYNELYCNSSTSKAWSVSIDEGWFGMSYRVKLNRGNIDDIPLTRDERKRLYTAYKDAIKREKAKWQALMQEARK